MSSTFYVKYRLTGAESVYSVIADDAQTAISRVVHLATTGQEYDVSQINLYGYAGLTPATGPTS